MVLNEQTVNVYTKMLQNPKQYNLDFRPLNEVIVKSETITALHILFNDYIEHTKCKGVPKVIFYIIIHDTYGNFQGVDKNGDAGYLLKVSQ